MELKEMIDAMKGINKFMYFSWNYESVYHDTITVDGERISRYIPRMVEEVNWSCNREHIINKWFECTDMNNPHAYMSKFYSELGGENRIKVMEWILNNYTSEIKLGLPEITEIGGFPSCPTRTAKAPNGEDELFAPTSYDCEDAWYDREIYAYVDDYVFYRASDKDFQKHIDELFD